MTESSPAPKWQSSTTTHDLILLTRFIRRRWWFFALCIIGLITFLGFEYHKRTFYSSRISFLVNTTSTAEVVYNKASESVDFLSDDQGFDRVSQIIYSSRMLDYLIEAFDLYSHYHIPSKDFADGYLLVTKRLKKGLAVSVAKTKIITVQVSDKLDPNVAANIANAIGQKINDINRQITIESLSRKIELFEALSKDLKQNSEEDIRHIDSLLKSMQRFITGSVNDKNFAQVLNMDIESLHEKSDEYFKTLFDSYKYKLFSLYSLQEKNLPTISVLEKALPDPYSKIQYNTYMYPLIALFSFLTVLVIFYLYMKAIPVVSYIFSNSRKI